MTNDVNISLVGDEELLQIIRSLDYAVQQKVLKKVVRDVANKTFVKGLRSAAPKRTGALRSSMGAITGKSKKNAVAFAGPRMGGKYKGYIANIIEYNKGEIRYPTRKNPKRPKTPEGVRLHSGRMPMKDKGFVKRTLEENVKPAEAMLATSVRTICEREIKRYAKR